VKWHILFGLCNNQNQTLMPEQQNMLSFRYERVHTREFSE